MDVRPGLWIARKAHALFVHEVHDLWPLTPKLLAGMSDRHPMIMWMQREEDLACKDADLVVSILPATLPYLQSRALVPSRWVSVSNGVPQDAIVDAGDAPGAEDGTFRVGYFGAHGPANDLETLVEAARLLQGDGVEVHLWGAGPSKPALQARAAAVANVRFHHPVSPTDARRAMTGMDALYIGLADSPLFEHGISPNKMFDYMAVGRPIIQAIDTPASPAEDAGCATICTPGDARSVARAVAEIRDLAPEQRLAMGRAGRQYVLTRATYPRLAKAFVGAVESARDSRP
jgi:glycosyltransferase involved in cell wall biosynthesis